MKRCEKCVWIRAPHLDRDAGSKGEQGALFLSLLKLEKAGLFGQLGILGCLSGAGEKPRSIGVRGA